MKVAGSALMIAGLCLFATSGVGLIQGGTAALKAGASLPAFVGDTAIAAGAGATGWVINKAPDYAGAPAAAKA